MVWPAPTGPVAYDSRRDRLLAFSGESPSLNGRLPTNQFLSLRLDRPSAWEVLSPPSTDPSLPSPRSGAAGVYDERRDAFVLMGGYPGGYFIMHLADDAWEFLLRDRQWKRIVAENEPRPLWQTCAAFRDSRRDRTLVFEDQAAWALGSAGERWNGRPWFDAAEGPASEALAVPPFALCGASPNPVAGATTVEFALPDAAPATLELFDVSGRRIWSEDVGGLGPGRHAVRVSPMPPQAPGVYIVRLAHGREAASRKIVLIER
jgi:hypothetical protein